MASNAAPSKFSAARITTSPDKSAGKTIITGDSGVGKTYLASTIMSDDGRTIFMLPVEEGLKGASPLHAPAKFSDASDNPILPTTFGELVEALNVFRAEVNVPRPPPGWIANVGYPTGPAHDVLSALVDVFPFALPIDVLGHRASVAASGVANIVDTLGRSDAQTPARIRRDPHGAIVAVPDRSWKRPHLHFGLDSLSGVEALIHREITRKNNVASMADKDFNALYDKALPLWQEVRDAIDAIRRTGVHVWLIAHATKTIDASHSTGEIYGALDLQFRGTGKALLALQQFWRQWADSIFYVVKDVEVRGGDKTRRSIARFTGRRLVTVETAMCRAKSRLALPPSIPATWSDLREAMKSAAPATPEKLAGRVRAMIPRLEVAEQGRVLSALDEATKAALPAAALSALLSRCEGLVLCAEEARATAADAAGDDSGQGQAPDGATTPGDASTGTAEPGAAPPEDAPGSGEAEPAPEGGM